MGRLHELQGRPRAAARSWSRHADAKLSPTDANNAVAAACGNSVALVGTTALFLQNVTAMENCKDKAGAATGIPDLAELQTEVAQQCSPISFATLPSGSECPYSGTGLRTFHVGYTQYDYYFKKFGADALHGVFVIPKDLPSTIASSMPIFRAENQMGIKSDAEFGKSGTAIQTDYTEVAAGDEVEQVDLRAQRPRLQGHGARCARKRRSRASTR